MDSTPPSVQQSNASFRESLSEERDEKTPLLKEKNQNISSPKATPVSVTSINKTCREVILALPEEFSDGKTTHHLSFMEHGNLEGNSIPVFFVPDAGFGSISNPDFSGVLYRLNARLIIIDRPGYGKTTFIPNYSIPVFVSDMILILSYLNLRNEKSFFIGYAAGCPYVLGLANSHPELVKEIAIVCPPNPLTGEIPYDRPEEFGLLRSWQRCCMINCFCCLVCCVGPLFNKWANDRKEYEKYLSQSLSSEHDSQFFNDNPEHIQTIVKYFQQSIQPPPNGTSAMIRDMLKIPKENWGFRVSDITAKTHVWYGTEDDVTPHGAWYCSVLQDSVDHKMNGYGHPLIYTAFDSIITSLIHFDL